MNCFRATRFVCLVVALSLSRAPAAPQPNAFTTSGFSARPAHRSPVLQADGYVAFALHAPQARTVVVAIGESAVMRVALARAADGWWEGRAGPIEPGLHQYTFEVDGVATIDPLNPRVKLGTVVYGTVLEVPDQPARFDAFQDVPQGVTHVLRYRSSAQQRFQSVHIYLPAAYAAQPDRRFPVLYLRHGGGDDDHSWLQDGRAGVILDNLLAQDAAQPMIIVATNGHTDGTWSHASSSEGLRLLERELIEDLIPLIDQQYRTVPDASHRALAGLSMGGGQAFVIGLRHMDTFAWIAEFSSGLLADRDLRLTEIAPAVQRAREVNAALRLLWVGCGTSDPRYSGHLNLRDELTALGVRTRFHESPGGHEWSVWRDQLHALLPVLFRPDQR